MDAAPELSPISVTLLGFPPNCSIFSWTHFSTITWSLMAWFPKKITPSNQMKNQEIKEYIIYNYLQRTFNSHYAFQNTSVTTGRNQHTPTQDTHNMLLRCYKGTNSFVLKVTSYSSIFCCKKA